ncbi:MAG: hypothetical protein JNM68_00505, partial [Dinghuibacter sp.]|nr:hypothetical protein [Dinghuibacter sp.]
MEQLLQIFIILPVTGILIAFLLNRYREKAISGTALAVAGAQLLGIGAFTVYWLLNGTPALEQNSLVFYEEGSIKIFLSFYFDRFTALFGFTGALITLLVLVFSKYYLHRDEGYKRFFVTVLLFFAGFNVAVFAGNFETLFIGWEFLGITSFLLVAFYRDRYLPVKNSLKTISLYRLGDICLMLALWMSHHLWHENITFTKLASETVVAEHIAQHYLSVLFLAGMLLAAAAVKSAQWPFSSWLPRAMEGPTTSSAVFYGSLSVHLGVFLLLRTYSYWSHLPEIKIAIIVIGVVTTIIASLIARVQPTVKTQIAYASVAQIGLMFVEVALGWHILVMVHFAGNALLRTYQLLVSPSVLGYLVHDQVFHYEPNQHNAPGNFSGRMGNTLYLLGIKEWNMDALLKKILWNPFKYAGRALYFISGNAMLTVLGVVYAAGVYLVFSGTELQPLLSSTIHILFAAISLLLVLAAFVERASAIKAWVLIVFSQFFCVLSVALQNGAYNYGEIVYYASGLIIAAVAGLFCLRTIQQKEQETTLGDFYGHVYHYPKTALVFLLSCLAFVALPFTPAFVGIDLLFSHIHRHEYGLLALTALQFLVLELAVLRIYARV